MVVIHQNFYTTSLGCEIPMPYNDTRSFFFFFFVIFLFTCKCNSVKPIMTGIKNSHRQLPTNQIHHLKKKKNTNQIHENRKLASIFYNVTFYYKHKTKDAKQVIVSVHLDEPN